MFIETCNITPHLETTLELAINHLNDGDRVFYSYIGHKVPYNDFPKPQEKLFFLSSSSEQLGIKLIRHPNLCLLAESEFQVKNDIPIPDFGSLAELKNYKYKNYNAGLACASSLITRLRSTGTDLTQCRTLVRRIIVSGISVYEFTRTILNKHKPDLLYIFNGRFANNRAIMEAANESNTDWLIHERGADKHRYALFSYMPQNLDRRRSQITEAWENASHRPEAVAIAREFFHGRRKGTEQGWRSFTAAQESGKSLRIEEKGSRLITYFVSSDDEFASIGDVINWRNWISQTYAIETLLDIVANLPDLVLAIRLHPHLSHKHPSELDRWLNMELPDNVVIIAPDDATDTYALMEASSSVVTSGSTTGIEAVFWGTPSICLGPSLYENLDAVYLPDTPAELKELLTRERLSVQPERALPYGYYMSTFGFKFQHYEPETLFTGKFLGVNLQEEHSLRKLKQSYRRVKSRLLLRAERRRPSARRN